LIGSLLNVPLPHLGIKGGKEKSFNEKVLF
jgi:hypothetical protein